MTKAAILGGGPGGLLTAYLLERKYPGACHTTLFEATERTGGKILTRQFDAAPVIYEAGAAEFYNYAEVGPDPLRELVDGLGLKTTPMSGRTVILDGHILRTNDDIRRAFGKKTAKAIRDFRARCAEALTKPDWYEGNSYLDNLHPWANRTCQEILDEVPDPAARKYLKVAAHSDLATEPHLTNGLNGLKNFLMDVPGYLRLYSIEGGNERVMDGLRGALTETRIELNSPVTRVEKNSDGTYRVSHLRAGRVEHGYFDAVFTALPHNALGSIDWGGEGRRGDALSRAMQRHIAFYDRPGHYLRVTILFRKPFWRQAISGSWFMLDAFGGCCVYDEGARHHSEPYGVLSWLIAGTDALSEGNNDNVTIVGKVLQSLPEPLRAEAESNFIEGRVHRWMASVNAQPGGLPVPDTRRAHLPDPKELPGLFMVGDYIFDSTLNGVLDSADLATNFFHSWRLKNELLALAPSREPREIDRSYFDEYHEDSSEGEGYVSYEDAYDSYFEADYLRDMIRIAFKAKPPYRLLDAGSANGLTLADLAKVGIKAWGIEKNEYIHSKTPAKWRKRNLLADVRQIPFPDNHFDFVYETCLGYLDEDELGPAIRELHRVTRKGLIFGSITTDMNPELFRKRDLLLGMKSMMPLWEWGELFLANGFTFAATDEKTLNRLWRTEKSANEGDDDWYAGRDSLRYCFYTKL
jgi:monoamine oxidase/SAM-dependent methyltransferase